MAARWWSGPKRSQHSPAKSAPAVGSWEETVACWRYQARNCFSSVVKRMRPRHWGSLARSSWIRKTSSSIRQFHPSRWATKLSIWRIPILRPMTSLANLCWCSPMATLLRWIPWMIWIPSRLLIRVGPISLMGQLASFSPSCWVAARATALAVVVPSRWATTETTWFSVRPGVQEIFKMRGLSPG